MISQCILLRAFVSSKAISITILSFLFLIETNAQNNTNLGTNAGNAGSENVSVGFVAGDVVSGSFNAFVGSNAGAKNTSGSSNSFFGYESGNLNTTANDNAFYGTNSGYGNTVGSQNVFIGSTAGKNNSNGVNNVFVGHTAGANNLSGARNVFVGQGSGYSALASDNSFFGYQSGRNIDSGTQNTFVGGNAGWNTVSGSGNVFLGYNAGYNETGSNKLFIDNTTTATPLIYGDFNSNQIGINSLPVSTHALTIGGSINAIGGVYVNGVAISGNVGNWAQDGTSLYNVLSDKVGIGTTTPTQRLDVNGNINASGILINGVPFAGGGSQWTTAAGTPNIYFTGAGVVSIGTMTAPTGYKLAVGGKAIAEEIVIKLQSNWPDYVFNKKYKLRSLSEVETFINANNHLPEIPAASEIEKNGLPVGEMNSLLLKKIEELTLYSIEQNKTLTEQSQIIDEQKKALEKQSNKMGELEQKLNELVKRLTK
jgi:hypothetical protein